MGKREKMNQELKKNVILVIIVISAMAILGYGMTCLFKCLLKTEVESVTDCL